MLFALLVAYMVPGLFGRDPWSLEDASAFGVMWTMAQGGLADWLLPGVVGQPLPEEGPLPFWVGAVLIRGASGAVEGIFTERDVLKRIVAEQRDPKATPVYRCRAGSKGTGPCRARASATSGLGIQRSARGGWSRSR